MDASVTLTEKVVIAVIPESKPPDSGVHGSEKLDWVTECWVELMGGGLQ